MNSIDYHADFDQIALSVRGNSEVWIIDHSTTTAEAKSHSGGKRGKGGDLLYRWGNPACYGYGTKTEQRYFEQHDVEWIPAGYPGAGNFTCFNNGLGRGNYSTVDEFAPAVDANGNYTMPTGSAALPLTYTWTYQGTTAAPMYSENISGANRLPNGNTIICSGTVGRFLEVTPAKEIVWEYICPVQLTGEMTQGQKPDADPARAEETMNSVFRVYKYPLDYAAFAGKTLTPGDFIEKYPTGLSETFEKKPEIFQNPFTQTIRLKNITGDEWFKLMNIRGELIWQGENIDKQDFSGLLDGVYLLNIQKDNLRQNLKLIKTTE
jgi:hypothetical protein